MYSLQALRYYSSIWPYKFAAARVSADFGHSITWMRKFVLEYFRAPKQTLFVGNIVGGAYRRYSFTALCSVLSPTHTDFCSSIYPQEEEYQHRKRVALE